MSVRSSVVSCVSVFLCVVLVFLCFARPLPLKAAVTETVAFFALFASVLAAMGIKFSVTGGTQALQDSMSSAWSGFKALNPLSPIIDVIENSFSRAFSSSDSYVAMSPAEFSAYQELADYYIEQNDISQGSFSSPAQSVLVPAYYIFLTASSGLDNVSASGGRFPIALDYATDVVSTSSVVVGDIYVGTLRHQIAPSTYLSALPISSFVNRLSFSVNDGAVVRTYNLSAIGYNYGTRYFMEFGSTGRYLSTIVSSQAQPQYGDFVPDLSFTPQLVACMDSSNASHVGFFAIYYRNIYGRFCISTSPNSVYGAYFPTYVVNTDSLSADSYGSPSYSFGDDSGDVYIDTGISGLSGYNDILSAIQQNLLDITTALQELNSGNLPVDVTPISTLISDFESLTNAVYAGTSTLSACLSAMYQELISALSGVNNLPYAQTLIDIYHSFVDKLSLFNSGSASSVSGDVASIKSLQSTLSGLRDDVADGTISADEAIDSAYQAYTDSLDGAADAVEASALLQSYQSFVDSLAISSYASAVSATATDLADYLALDDGLMDLFDVSRLEAWMDYEHYTFLPSDEANLYREYFNDLSDIESPTYNYIFVPLSLLFATLLLGTGISYVRSKK